MSGVILIDFTVIRNYRSMCKHHLMDFFYDWFRSQAPLKCLFLEIGKRCIYKTYSEFTNRNFERKKNKKQLLYLCVRYFNMDRYVSSMTLTGDGINWR